MPDRFRQYNLNAEGIDVRLFGEWLWKNPMRHLGGIVQKSMHLARLPIQDFYPDILAAL